MFGKALKMSNKYYANESVFDWCMVLLLEDYEHLPAVNDKNDTIFGMPQRLNWLRNFQRKNEEGEWEWLENSNNEWGHKWAQIVEDRLDCIDMPTSMKHAIVFDIVNDFSCRDDADNGNPIFMNEIKDFAVDDGLELKE